ncbi:MAG: hypothetical protein QXV32_03600 [Conexivisphaerales archaeon]
MKSLLLLSALGIVAIGLALMLVPSANLAFATNVPCPGVSVSGPLQATLPAGTTSTLIYTITWAGFTSPTTLAVTTNSPPSGWSWSASPSSVPVSGSGSATVTVSVTTPTLVGSVASLTVTATDGTCGGSTTTAAHTTGLNTTPEFAAGMLAALGAGIVAIMALRRQTTKMPVVS